MKETFENIVMQIIVVREDVIVTSNGNAGMFTQDVSTGDKNDFGGNIL